MTKEMTTEEITELNQEFDSANAETKWKFMQTDEYKRLPDAVRYTVERECLSYYFDRLTEGMKDWKMPIRKIIPNQLLTPMRAACEYFTGTELHVVRQMKAIQTYPLTDVEVTAKGYYMMGE